MRRLDHDYLLSLLSYNEETGVFTWLVDRGRVKIGDIAGCVKSRGHISLRIDYGNYKAHRLAWFYVMGKWPPDQIDHIDGNPGNNCFANLRLANNSQNHCNKLSPLNTSGFKGVSFLKSRGRWAAHIKKNQRSVFLGYFDTAELAAEAYRKAAPIYHGEFARIE